MPFSIHTVNERDFTTLGPLEQEFHLEKDKNYLFDLSYLSSLHVIGESALNFLQGQLSCDLRQVNATTIRQGAQCNLKGRVLALMDVVNWQGLHLVLPQDLLQATQQSLSKIALLSRVTMNAEDTQIYGFYFKNSKDLLPEGLVLPKNNLCLFATALACCYRLTPQFYLLLIKKEQASILSQPFGEKQQIRGSLSWHRLQLERKAFEIYPITRGSFLPQRLDLHRSDYLSFDKGCYKGQEIIARMHYRAKPKHSLELFKIETDEVLRAGKKIFRAETETEVGELVDYCPLTSNSYLIAASILFNKDFKVLIENHRKPVLLVPYFLC